MEKVDSYHDEKWSFIITKAPTKNCYYYVSNYGRVKSVHKKTKNERIRNLSLTAGKYPTLGLKLQGNVGQGFSLRKLVAQYFLNEGKESDLLVINKDRDLLNNHVNNIAYVTQEEYTKFIMADGWLEKTRESREKTYKMNEAKVRLLLRRIKEGKTKKKILAKQFGITFMQLNRIERGENWGHVRLEEDE